MEPTHRFLRACRGLPVDRVPLWLMRQAGRYLPEYRAVRARTDFLRLCKTPELACEVTLQPIDIFGLDAAILFSDILLPLEAMGLPLVFTEEGPWLPEPVRDAAAIARLRVPDPEVTMPFVAAAVRQIRAALGGRVPLIGFGGAPFTLAAYAVEGGGSTQWVKGRRLLYEDPASAHELLGKVARTVAAALVAQVDAGAEAIQLFDSWAGVLAPPEFEAFALRYAAEVIATVKAHADVPVIYFVNGVAPLVDLVRQAGADVLGIDWRVDLGEARRRLGPIPVQGNLDPVAMFAPPSMIEAKASAILRAGGGVGHIFNLGHGILPETPVANVRALVAAVRAHTPEKA
jgi:uroporphyrinogen decarboxylase